MKKKILIIYLFFVGCVFSPGFVLAHQPRLIFSQQGDIQVSKPEISQAFYDELKGAPRDYFINSETSFELYINLLVPAEANRDSRYSADIFSAVGGDWKKIYSIDGLSFDWQQFYEEFSRDYYLKGPEFTKQVPAGKYRINVYSAGLPAQEGSQGKYILAVGKIESFDVNSLLNVYWQLPLLKLTFFKTSVLQFFLTPFGIVGIGAIGGLLIFIAVIYWLIGLVRTAVKHRQAKTLLLTSAGMMPMQDEIIKLLQKPAYDVLVGFITTASNPEENKDYMQKDLEIMRQIGFNVEEYDIEGKKPNEIMKFLETKDIIYVEGGSTFYLLKAMRACKFEKVIRKLLKQGKVYIGVSAGSIIVGKTIKTSDWKHPEERFRVKNLKGLNLVPFDIFVHYQPEHAELIKQRIKNPKKRAKNLMILTDEQAILVQGKEVSLIGDGEAIVV